MKINRSTGIALAIAAAGMFATIPAVTMASSDSHVKCFGVNKCKGNNDCKTANNSCKGKSACKGKGFVNMTKDACDKIGGKVDA